MAATDSSVRQLAVQPDASFIVQAPAGSGKTELLTQRYLRLLSGVEKPERVLAITFTRKATQEMRERIMLRLRQAGQGLVPEPEHERLAVELASRVLARSAAQGWDLLDNPGRLQIQTIDGLCARISGRAPQPGKGVTGLVVIEDARPLYQKAARRLIEDASDAHAEADLFAALSRVLVFLKGNAATLQDMLASMLGQRDQWLNRLGVSPDDMRYVLAAQQQIELQALAEILGAGQLQTLAASLRAMAQVATERESAELLLATLRASSADPSDSNLATLAAWRSLKTVATSVNQPYSPRSVKSRVLAAGSDAPADALDSVRTVLAQWNESETASNAFKRFVSSPPLHDPDDAQAVLNDFQLLLVHATAQLRVLFTEAGQTDFIYVAEMALQALGDELLPGDALLFEDGALEHILLDEFQDTSFTQFELVHKLVSGWQPGDGRSLFLVGDPMQSIYRFRKADVSLFNQVFKTGALGPVTLQALRLTSNFRSRSEIIEWVNQQFPVVFTPPAHAAANFVGYTPVDAEQGSGGRVVAHPFPELLGPQGEAELIADLVVETTARHPEMSIAVLGRARVQLEFVATALRKRQQAFEAVQVESLNTRPVILDLLMILRAILHPADRIAWLALLRAPWCALNADELLTVAGASADDEILSRIDDETVLEQLPEAKRTRLLALRQVMNSAISALSSTPISRLVEVSWLRLKGPYAVGSREELDNASLFFKLLRTIEDEQPQDLVATVMERLENFFSGSTQSRVKLMTIHKAKGLEFDMVILPGLHRGKHGPDLPMLRIQDIQLGEDLGVLMAARKRKDAENPGLYDYLGRLETEQQGFEACRVLYVAATRAKAELHLFGGWKWNKKEQQPYCSKGTFMDLLWTYFEPRIDALDEPSMAEAEVAHMPPLLPQLYLQNEPELAFMAATPEAGSEFPELRIPDPESIALGQAFHLWMQLMHDHWSPQWTADWFGTHRAALESSLLAAGASRPGLPALVDTLYSMIRNTLKDTDNRELISPEGKSGSWAEIALISREGNRLQRHILDRLYRDDSNDFFIVDYKTGAGNTESKLAWDRQLERYANLVQECTNNKVKESSIYHPEGD